MRGGDSLITTEDIMEIALCFTDRTLTEGETAVLTTLCGEANRLWESRLRDELDPEVFMGMYCRACAYTALGNFNDGMGAGEPAPVSFRLGEFSVNRGSGTTVVRRSLQAQAEALMAPFTTDGDFAFLEVVG